MTRLLHIADLHFGDESPALVESLTAYCLHNPPDAIIAAGDFTQGGRRREFERARDFFASVQAPVVGAPGNHDVPSYALDHRFLTPWQRFFRLVGDVVSPRLHTDAVQVETLHTARRSQWRLDWSLGRVSRRDLGELIGRFDTDHDRVRIAACHHPLIAPEGATGRAKTRRGPEAAEALAPYCHLVLTGHLHRTFAIPVDAGSHTCWFLGASTAFSGRTRIEPAGFNEMVLEEEYTRLIHHEADDDGRFHPVRETELPRKL
ncbi:metallophosphoesterase family protein [Hyphobacterium marinum]|uniref:Metallophosphoesterase n=1 Tax=Hyphobacterium marinum TaxID=3116574 RepID=A0ABU7LVS6_9PROT|nr:metallophosphoesterase [Hyphobacterium sp. Y6023]MEE2565668.1 metallophosphoesterase [Hyphobacterium sp. Y6023]